MMETTAPLHAGPRHRSPLGVGAAVLFCAVMPVVAAAQAPPSGELVQPSGARRPFDAASVARAVEAERRLQVAVSAQAPAPAARKRDSVWTGVLIGAGVGAVAGGVLTVASGDDCGTGPDYGGGCAMVGAATAGPAFVAGAIVGSLLSAGIGAIVDLLIKYDLARGQITGTTHWVRSGSAGLVGGAVVEGAIVSLSK